MTARTYTAADVAAAVEAEREACAARLDKVAGDQHDETLALFLRIQAGVLRRRGTDALAEVRREAFDAGYRYGHSDANSAEWGLHVDGMDASYAQWRSEERPRDAD